MPEEEKKKLLSLIEPKNKIILDVGCGDGRYCELFKDTCQKYVGIDIDEQLIEQNKEKNLGSNVFYECADIINYFPDYKFDVIILSLSFHEIDIKEQGTALLNMLHLLKEDGEIILLDPTLDKDSFQGLWNVAYENLKLFNHDYIVKHSKEVIQRAVESKKCKVIKRDSLDIKIEFEKIDEIFEMLQNSDDFKGFGLDSKINQKLEKEIRQFVKVDNNIILYDKLDIIVIGK